MTMTPLAGCRIVIVEDDYYQAQDSKQMLEGAGAQVIAIAATVPDLDALLRQGRVDAGLIDINLGHGLSLDFARALQRSAIPFLFLTGYDAGILPEDLAGSPCLSKPADSDRVIAELGRLTGAGAGAGT